MEIWELRELPDPEKAACLIGQWGGELRSMRESPGGTLAMPQRKRGQAFKGKTLAPLGIFTLAPFRPPTRLDPEEEWLWENPSLPGRTSGDWQRIEIDLSAPRYQGLTNQEVAFIWTTPGGAIDLDTIEVYAATGAGAGDLQLSLAASEATPGSFDFEWNSSEGRVYDLVSSDSLAVPVVDWEVFEGNAEIAATGERTTLTDVPVSDVRRFFAIVEK